MSIKEKAAELLASTDALHRVEVLLLNQLYLDEAAIRADIESIGFKVMAIGERWCIEFPGSIRSVVGKDESAASAIKQMVIYLREHADKLEGFIK